MPIHSFDGSLPEHPFELADGVARKLLMIDPETAASRLESYDLNNLDFEADALGFIGAKFFVESWRSISIPVSFDADKPVPIGDFDKRAFEGRFACYSKVVIGQIIGSYPVSALCASFHEATMLPYFEEIPEENLLHVPILAAKSTSKRAA